MHEKLTTSIVDGAGSDCAAGVFVIHIMRIERMIDSINCPLCRPKARGVDSESQFLATKKFSCLTA
jgi:hypothetical protein